MKRITLSVEDEVYEGMNEHIPHGFRRHLIGQLIKLTVEAIERDGPIMIGAIMHGGYKLVRDEERDKVN